MVSPLSWTPELYEIQIRTGVKRDMSSGVPRTLSRTHAHSQDGGIITLGTKESASYSLRLKNGASQHSLSLRIYTSRTGSRCRAPW